MNILSVQNYLIPIICILQGHYSFCILCELSLCFTSSAVQREKVRQMVVFENLCSYYFNVVFKLHVLLQLRVKIEQLIIKSYYVSDYYY